ncbi:MAG TPA: hypothetical protein VNV37_10915 [Solirubrobacteraceae bacterium]|nr:hypothetical protein [Solirubrobacteraceae bacterium]
MLLVGLSYATLIEDYSWNQTSHYDLLQALYHEQTDIDPYQRDTGDKVFYRGHWYSARAPGLALFVLPWYTVLNGIGARQWARESPAEPRADELIYLVGLWGNVLPGLLLLVLVWSTAERLQPGFGAATAVTLGLGTLALTLSTLLFSHIFTAFLGFAAFVMLMRERDGPPRAWLCGAAGLAIGYAVASEYPLATLGGVLGVYLLSHPHTRGLWWPRRDAHTAPERRDAHIAPERRDALAALRALCRPAAYLAGIAVGLIPLALYNLAAFHSLTHVAYANVPQQHAGFFGITAPSLRVAATLLGDSRGLFTLAPVLVMGALGTVALYRRGRRAEALTIVAVCLLYLAYNSGYYLPFGGGSPGPRFLGTTLPFLALGLAISFKRWPGPTIALAAVSLTCSVLAAIAHPLIGYETETVSWMRHLLQGYFQPTIASAYGLGRGWGEIWVFLLPAGGAIALAAYVTPRVPLTNRALRAGLLTLAGWALYAALAPTLLGLDHSALLDILHSGDREALAKGAYFGPYPLRALVPLACGFALVALAGARYAWRDAHTGAGSSPTRTRRAARAASALRS